MIKKAQIKFIAIVMCILFCVFLLIFGIYFFIMRNATENETDKALNNIVSNIISQKTPLNTPPANSLIVTFTPIGGEMKTEIFYDKDVFTLDRAKSIISAVVNSNTYSGNIENVYFKFLVSSENGSNFLIALDRSETIAHFSYQLITMACVLLIFYAILFFVVCKLSASVFKPIRESFYKQREFISNASHELKTPLAIISANTDVISSNKQNPYADSIKMQIKRMDVLVADMLTLAKMDEGVNKLNSINFNLSDEILSDVLVFDSLAFENKKTIQTNILPNIIYKGDIHSVKNIISIIIDNAIKHAKSNSVIEVNLKKENGKIVFTVFNAGSNVPDQDSNKIFERFYRPDRSRSRDFGGSGLGLAIAKSIADTNKWKISAQSVLDKSMKITIVF